MTLKAGMPLAVTWKITAMPAIANERQEAAARLMALGKSQKEAYTKAGYSYTHPAASNFFKKPTIAARVRELMKEQADREAKIASKAADAAGVTREWVVERLKYVAEVAIRGAPVRDRKTGAQVVDASGKPLFDGKMQLNAATRALNLLGIDIGMFVQRHEVGDPGEFARLSNDELEARVVKDMRALGIDGDALEVLIEHFSTSSATVGEA